MKLKSIAEEAAACREAFKGSKIGDPVWLCHHEVLAEVLTQDAEARISYILNVKPDYERALRLRLFRPIDVSAMPEDVKKTLEALLKAQDEYNRSRDKYEKRMYDRELSGLNKTLTRYYRTLFPGSPWNTVSIFPQS